MDYAKLIRDAWATTWRYRFLWVLGILAGGGVGVPALNGGGGSSGWRVNQADLDNTNPQLAAAARDITEWSVANAPLLVFAVVVFGLFLLGLVVLSMIAQGSMARATADLAIGQPSSLGRAWQAGLRLFWRYLGLWLMLIVIGALVAATVAGLAVLAFGAGAIAQAPSLTAALLALLAVVLLTILIFGGLALSIVIAFAQRAIAVEDVGPVDAIRSGWRLLRAHLGDSLLAWLINLGLAIASGVVVVAGVIAACALLFAFGAALWAAVGFTAPIFAYGGLAIVALLAVVVMLGGIANTFFWNYWTLAYLRLSGRLPAAA
jgi:hypothetical protein